MQSSTIIRGVRAKVRDPFFIHVMNVFGRAALWQQYRSVPRTDKVGSNPHERCGCMTYRWMGRGRWLVIHGRGWSVPNVIKYYYKRGRWKKKIKKSENKNLKRVDTLIPCPYNAIKFAEISTITRRYVNGNQTEQKRNQNRKVWN